jgi:hypothetical protein
VTALDHTPAAELRGHAFVELREPLWSYLAVSEQPRPADVVFSALGVRALRLAGIGVRRALLVAKPFSMRRCAATFRLRHLEVEPVCCPPQAPMPDFVERSRPAFAARLVAELDRLTHYPHLGYTAPDPIPAPRRVIEATEEVRRLLGAAVAPALT